MSPPSSASLARETCVLRYALEHHARTMPDTVYAAFSDGTRWTYQDTLDKVRAAATVLRALGVKQGDRVLLMLPNGALGLQIMFAANYLGAVFVPINPALKGSLLEHVVADSGARLAVVQDELLTRFDEIDTHDLSIIISSAERPGRAGQLEVLPGNVLNARSTNGLPLETAIEPWHTQSIIYTSGTTGRSKGVLSSYMHSYSALSPETWTCTRVGDRHLLHMPIFHIGGAFIACVCLCTGSSVAVVPSFKTDTFWQTVRELEVTVAFLLGAMATFLLKAPVVANEKDHPLRMVFIVPLGGSGPEFGARFGVDVYTLFNMTEISTPLLSEANPRKPNVCGRPRPGVTVRLVDENDCEVPNGVAGQLIIRTDRPWAMNHGYNNNPQATADAWRNGWFHTGDAFIRDEDGDYYFVDRLKDTIRRRGENISSFEIEVELLAHPDVREAAAVPVPSEFTEDEVLVVLAPVEGCHIDPAEIIAFLEERLARHMLPRFIRIVPELPKTPTAKVQKHILRTQGVTADTWERDTKYNKPTRTKNETVQ